LLAQHRHDAIGDLAVAGICELNAISLRGHTVARNQDGVGVGLDESLLRRSHAGAPIRAAVAFSREGYGRLDTRPADLGDALTYPDLCALPLAIGAQGWVRGTGISASEPF